MTDDDELRALLGLKEGDVLRLEAEEPRPPDEVGRGYATAAVAPPRTRAESSLAARVRESPFWSPVLGDWLASPLVALRRWDREPDVLVLDLDAGDVRVVAGTPIEIEPQLVALDSRAERFVARFAEPDGERIVTLERGHVRTLRVVPSDPSRLAGLAVPHDEPEVTLPPGDPASWLGSEPCEPWLRAACDRLAEAPSPASRAASAGLLARLWTQAPVGPEPRALGPSGVLRAVQAWARAIDAHSRDALETLALARAEALEAQLDAIDGVLAGCDAESAALVTRGVWMTRDELESLCVVLALAGAEALLGEALESLDDRAELHLTSLTESASDEPDEHLDAVAWQEPEQWWGALAR